MTPEAALAALYLRGAPRAADPPRRGWPGILATLRREGADRPVESLQRAGMALPATILETPGLLRWAEEAAESGAVLTAASEGYPLRWFEAFGDAAPPALWREGALPRVPWVGAVGSREIPETVAIFMAEVGGRAATGGWGLVSGGAAGCDTAAERGALDAGGTVLRLLPHGLRLRPSDDGAVHLSLAAPYEPFSRGLAMERNALIYAAAEATVVGHARMRQGGTWHGATDALRRRLGRVLVRPDGSPAARALRALGAEEFGEAAELTSALSHRLPPRSLFAYERRARRGARYPYPMENQEVVRLHTNLGDVVVELLTDVAPKHAASFKKLAQDGFFDGTRFHRVIPGFMIQGGDPNSKTPDRMSHGTGGPGYKIPAEFNDVKHERGILSAARSSDPNSAGSQFFLMVAPSPHLDRQYSAFGRVIEGMDVVDKIVALPRDRRDNPLEENPAIVEKATVETR